MRGSVCIVELVAYIATYKKEIEKVERERQRQIILVWFPHHTRLLGGEDYFI